MIEMVFLKNKMKSNNLLVTFSGWRQYSEILFWKQSLERIPRSYCGIWEGIGILVVLQLGSIKRPFIANLVW